MPDNDEIASIIRNLGADAFPQTNYDGLPFNTEQTVVDENGNKVPGIDLNLLDAFLREKGYLDPAISEWEQQNEAVQDALYENNMYEQSSRWQGQYDAIHSVLQEQEDSFLKSIANVDTTYYSDPRWIQAPPTEDGVVETGTTGEDGEPATPPRSTTGSPVFVTDTPSACISVLRLLKNNELVMEYAFYVSPESVEINSPSRVGVYQSIGGATYIDHMGAGVTSITLTGQTGYQRKSDREFRHINFGYIQYLLLKKLVNTYNDECAMGNAHLLQLTLTLSFPDAPQYGQWDVSIKELVLRRAVQQGPLRLSYHLVLLCLSVNKIQVARPTIAVQRVIPDHPVQAVAPEAMKYTPEVGAGVGPDGREESAPAAAAAAAPALPYVSRDSGAVELAPNITPRNYQDFGEVATVAAPPVVFTYTVPPYPDEFDNRSQYIKYPTRDDNFFNVRLLKKNAISSTSGVNNPPVEYAGFKCVSNPRDIELSALAHDSKSSMIASISMQIDLRGVRRPILFVTAATGSNTTTIPFGHLLLQNSVSKAHIFGSNAAGVKYDIKIQWLTDTEWGTERGQDAGDGYGTLGAYGIRYNKIPGIASDDDMISPSQTMTISNAGVADTSSLSLFAQFDCRDIDIENSAVITVASWTDKRFLGLAEQRIFAMRRLMAQNSEPALPGGYTTEFAIPALRGASGPDENNIGGTGAKAWRIANFFLPRIGSFTRKNWDGSITYLTLRAEFATPVGEWGGANPNNIGDWYKTGAFFLMTMWRNVDGDRTANQPALIQNVSSNSTTSGNVLLNTGSKNALSGFSDLSVQYNGRNTHSYWTNRQNTRGAALVSTVAGNFAGCNITFPGLFDPAKSPGGAYHEIVHEIVGSAINTSGWSGVEYTSMAKVSKDASVLPDGMDMQGLGKGADFHAIGLAAAEIPDSDPMANGRANFKVAAKYTPYISLSSIIKGNYGLFTAQSNLVATEFILFSKDTDVVYGGGLPTTYLDQLPSQYKGDQWGLDAPRSLGEIIYFFYGYDYHLDGSTAQYVDDGPGSYVADPATQIAREIMRLNPSLFNTNPNLLAATLEDHVRPDTTVRLPSTMPNLSISNVLNNAYIKELRRLNPGYINYNP